MIPGMCSFCTRLHAFGRDPPGTMRLPDQQHGLDVGLPTAIETRIIDTAGRTSCVELHTVCPGHQAIVHERADFPPEQIIDFQDHTTGSGDLECQGCRGIERIGIVVEKGKRGREFIAGRSTLTRIVSEPPNW